jgi:hypothetical protein
MKSDLLNPWLVIRWGFVLLVFILGSAIALDEINVRDKKITELEKNRKSALLALTKLGKNLEDTQNTRRLMSEKLLELQADLPKQFEDAKLLGKLEYLQKDLQNFTIEQENTAVNATPVHRPSSSYVAPIPVPVIPSWVPIAPSLLNKQIKDKAIAEWKDDYRMINHSIDSQLEGYDEVISYYKTGNSAVKDLINKAAQKWPGNYRMMSHEIKSQIEAKQQLERR